VLAEGPAGKQRARPQRPKFSQNFIPGGAKMTKYKK
jgi:hypothetical protein